MWGAAALAAEGGERLWEAVFRLESLDDAGALVRLAVP